MTDGLDARPERRLSAAGGPAPVEDDTIQSLAEEIEEDEERGGSESDAAPFDLGIPEPRAIDLRKVWKLAGQKPDAQILAALGPNVPVLLSHSITAFPVGAGKPPRVWGIRYGSQLFGIDARTVDNIRNRRRSCSTCSPSAPKPSSPLASRRALGTRRRERRDRDGAGPGTERCPGCGLARPVGEAPDPVHVVRAEGDRGDRGAPRQDAWQLYAQDRRLDGHQAMLQTLLVPKGTQRIRTEIVASVGRSR